MLIIPGTISAMTNIADIVGVSGITLTIIATNTGMSGITTTVIADGMVTGVTVNSGIIIRFNNHHSHASSVIQYRYYN